MPNAPAFGRYRSNDVVKGTSMGDSQYAHLPWERAARSRSNCANIGLGKSGKSGRSWRRLCSARLKNAFTLERKPFTGSLCRYAGTSLGRTSRIMLLEVYRKSRRSVLFPAEAPQRGRGEKASTDGGAV